MMPDERFDHLISDCHELLSKYEHQSMMISWGTFEIIKCIYLNTIADINGQPQNHKITAPNGKKYVMKYGD